MSVLPLRRPRRRTICKRIVKRAVFTNITTSSATSDDPNLNQVPEETETEVETVPDLQLESDPSPAMGADLDTSPDIEGCPNPDANINPDSDSTPQDPNTSGSSERLGSGWKDNGRIRFSLRLAKLREGTDGALTVETSFGSGCADGKRFSRRLANRQ